MSIARELDEARRDVDRMKAVLRSQEREVRDAQQSEREMMGERDGLAMTCEDLRQQLKNTRAELAEARGRWISTSERLPEAVDGDRILIWCKMPEYMTPLRSLSYDRDGWFSESGARHDLSADWITHWTPILPPIVELK